MIPNPNLLATSEIWRESEACSELWMLLRAVGDETPNVDRTRVRGLIAASTQLDPLEAIYRLRAELRRDPGGFRTLLRVLPLETTVPTKVEAMVEETRRLSAKIDEGESFRVTLEKRRTNLRSREVIDAVAQFIDREVDLEDYDWIVLVEIVGRMTGISVVPSDGVLNIQKERAKLMAEGQ
ncbi:MAG: THUMP domain-containing protein [Candidatus Bathyarchaeota archaeon]